MNTEAIYRCTKPCKINKRCFILKTELPLRQPIAVLHKCQAEKKDIRLIIGEESPP